ncbi:MAG: hypothetical protein GY928_37960 [Colwellia sp.]|nr:hypothetical protein [Colwellia sp.]
MNAGNCVNKQKNRPWDSWFAAELWSVSIGCGVWTADELVVRAMSELWGRVDLGSVSVDCGVGTVFEEATAELGRSPLGSVSVDCGVDRGSNGRIEA